MLQAAARTPTRNYSGHNSSLDPSNMTPPTDTRSSTYSPPSEGWSSPSSSSTSDSFVNIPPGGRFIVNEKLVPLPIKFIPLGRQSDYFQPRDKELLEIKTCIFNPHQLASKAPSHRSFLITGLGGAGKTELAFEFVKQFGQDFGAIFFLVADSQSRLLEQYSTIACNLGLANPSDGSNQEVCSETFRIWLGDPVQGAPQTQEAKTLVRWLLVLDNAETPDVIRKFWPGGDHGSILVTTRNPLLAAPELCFTGKLQLTGFPTVEGAHLLRFRAEDNRTDDAHTEADARDIVQWVQGCPMAIAQLGRIIHNGQLSISQFREIYPTKHSLYARLYNGKENERTLVTTWALDGLQQRQQDIFALLCLIAMLDPEGIEHRTLRPRSESSNADGSPTQMSNYISYRKYLSNTSLIDVNRENQEVRVHRVVQDVTMEKAIRCGFAGQAFRDAIGRIDDQWPFLNRSYVTGSATQVNRWKECRRAYPHILRLMEVHAELIAASVTPVASMQLSELLLEAVQYRVECGAGHEAVPLLNAVEAIYKPNHPDCQVSAEDLGKYFRGRIGLAVSSKNTDDLLQYAQLAWDCEKERHKTLGYDTSILAVAYNDLAHAWACQCEWERAVDMLAESRTIRESLPGFSRDKLFSPLYHTGLVLYHQGKYDEAEEILDEAIQDRETAFGRDDVSSVRSAALFYARGNVRLARADEVREDVRKSLGDHVEAASRAKRSAGANNRTTLICQYQMARVNAALGNFDGACTLLANILYHTIDEPTYHRDIARTSYLYASCLQALERHDEADEELSRSLLIHNRLRHSQQRTKSTLTTQDISSLIPYDYL